MAEHATGAFDVKVEPQGDPDKADGSTLARYSLDKQYHGDLEGTSKGTMLTAGTEVKGSAGYVALERVTGTLRGRSGSFVLQHSATMTRGEPQLSITVVPDSGSGQLVGIAGKMTIIIAAGKHSYEFEYTLPPAPVALFLGGGRQSCLWSFFSSSSCARRRISLRYGFVG